MPGLIPSPTIHGADREMRRATIIRAQSSTPVNFVALLLACSFMWVVDYWPMLAIALGLRVVSIVLVHQRSVRLLRALDGNEDAEAELRDWSNVMVIAGMSWSLLLWCIPAGEMGTLPAQGLFAILLFGVASIINTIVVERRALLSFAGSFGVSALAYFIAVIPVVGSLPLLTAILGAGVVAIFAVHVYRQQMHISTVFADNEMLAHSLQQANVELSDALAIADRLAHYDQLTGLRNRRCFEQEARRIQRGRQCGDRYHLLLLDIDRFKAINDRFGHAFGDRVLHHVGTALEELGERTGDLLPARLGGEEFAIILGGQREEDVRTLVREIRQRIAGASPALGEAHVDLTVSIGVTCWREDETVHTAMLRADRMLYASKDAGRDQASFDFGGGRRVA
ncbi:diguanylate cyclase [Sphingomicrobium sp. XHP0239]|uniref:GGDEF domain-containing protein n=1 Tax=Sphingomicrobium maritimum TaxID=3133972 RepID=UPI0031CC852F